MEVIVKKVEPGAEYEGVIYDFWVDVELKSGRIITLFDHLPFDLRGLVGQRIDCLVMVMACERNDHGIDTVNGVFVGEYPLTKGMNPLMDWLSGFAPLAPLIVGDDCEMVVSRADLGAIPKKGDLVRVNVSRYDLVAFRCALENREYNP